MINPPQVLPEEPTAVTPHGGFCGGKSQHGCATRQSRTSGSVRGDRGNPVPYRDNEIACQTGDHRAVVRVGF
jgi:hypothetical protein